MDTMRCKQPAFRNIGRPRRDGSAEPGEPSANEWFSSVAINARPRGDRDRVQSMSNDANGGKAALDRIVIAQETLDRVSEMVSPRSSRCALEGRHEDLP
jgi:hypothetical protein